MSEYICPHCGKPIEDDDALLCLYCGENLERGVGFIGKMKYSVNWGILVFMILVIVISFFLLILR